MNFPTGLRELYKLAESTKFRVRHIDTLDDFMILGVTKFDTMGLVERLSVLNLQTWSYNDTSAEKNGYVMLSSAIEISQMRLMSETQVLSLVKKSYNDMNLPF